MRAQMLFVAALVALLATAACVQAQFGKKPTQPSDPTQPKPDEPKIVKPKFVPAPPQKWEYLVEYRGKDLQADLDKLGAEGWELVAIEPTQRLGSASTMIFRRPVAKNMVADPKPNQGGPGPRGVKPGGFGPAVGPNEKAPEPAPKKAAAPKTELRVYSLKYANAVDLAGLIEAVLAPTDPRMRIAAEPRTNQIVVNGTGDAHDNVQALLSRLDVSAPTPGDIAIPGGTKKKKS